MSLTVYISWIVVYLVRKGYGVPPDACFAKFRTDDCGLPPKPVMYYWKSGSRCEVGMWRGCLPNINMFEDEYECVSTCMFSARAEAIDYHSFTSSYNEIDYISEDTDNIEDIITTPDGDDDITTVSDDNDTLMTTTDSTNEDVTTTQSTVSGDDIKTTNAPETSPSNESNVETATTTPPE